jgi:hypothetical protein
MGTNEQQGYERLSEGLLLKRDVLYQLLEEQKKLSEILVTEVDEPLLTRTLSHIELLQEEVTQLDDSFGLHHLEAVSASAEIEKIAIDILGLLQQIEEKTTHNTVTLQNQMGSMNEVLAEVTKKKKYISGYAPQLEKTPRYIDQKR